MTTDCPYKFNATGGSTTAGTSVDWAWVTYSVADDKKTNIEKFIFSVESEDRLKMILEKVKTKKLSIEEAILILKGDKSISIG